MNAFVSALHHSGCERKRGSPPLASDKSKGSSVPSTTIGLSAEANRDSILDAMPALASRTLRGVGGSDGCSEGAAVVGNALGEAEGEKLGSQEGGKLGDSVGSGVGAVGALLGSAVLACDGVVVGAGVGVSVGKGVGVDVSAGGGEGTRLGAGVCSLHWAAVRTPSQQLVLPVGTYPLSHVGWHVVPLGTTAVQVPRAPCNGAAEALQFAA
jgi:hypothetical protein